MICLTVKVNRSCYVWQLYNKYINPLCCVTYLNVQAKYILKELSIVSRVFSGGYLHYSLMGCNLQYGLMGCNLQYGLIGCKLQYGLMGCKLQYGQWVVNYNTV